MSVGGLLAATSAWSVSLSPGAEQLAYVSDHDGWPRLVTCALDGANPRTLDTGADPVQEARVSHDGAWIAFTTAPGGSPRTQAWAVRPDGTGLHPLSHTPGGATYLGQWTHHPRVVSLAHTTTPPHGVAELVDVEDGTRRVIAEGGQPIVLDVDQQLRCALIRRGPRGARSVWLVDLGSKEERELRVGDEPGESDLGRLSPDGSIAYLRSNAGRELYALFALPLAGGEPRVLAERPDAELEQLILSSDGHLAALLWNRAGQSECELLDLRSGGSRQLLLPEPHAHGGSFSQDARWLAMTLEGPTHPRAVHVLDTASGAWRRVTAQPQNWTQPTATPQLVKLRGEDGLPLTAWLYLASPGLAPAAAVIHLHGGPEAQERPSYNPLFQALVQRGISVLAPNVRGSSGFGKTFVNADNRELRWGAIADVAACARYLFDEGLATRQTLGCAGRSYGGYLTLASLVFHPDLFAAGLNVCGMSDLQTFYRETEPWIAQAAYPKYGHPVDDAETLRRLSPIHYFNELRAPLLVVHGENDSNVPLGEALRAVTAAEAQGVSAELLLFRDEGHELQHRKNRELFVTRSADFLEERLRGTRSPALLSPEDPPPFRVREGQPTSPFLLTCDHAGRVIPSSLGALGLPEAELTRHIAWDIGAAQLSERLSAKLGAFLILQTYSRLVIDCNRPLDASSSIADLSEATVIPGNQGLTSQEAERRAAAIFRPYHERIERELLRRQNLGTPTIYVAVHSFTPRYLNVDRDMHVGVLYGKDARFAHQVLARLRADGRWVVGDNEPYQVSETTDYGVIYHAERRGIPYVELEIRQDLIAESSGQSEWAELMAQVLVDAART
jgi:predicted N-formylglutamate amidohydrolase/dipeptidyl aminopeptidase/acylaminoacyl peptidase